MYKARPIINGNSNKSRLPLKFDKKSPLYCKTDNRGGRTESSRINPLYPLEGASWTNGKKSDYNF